MDRIIQQVGAAPLAEDGLESQRFAMIALGRLARLVLGDAAAVDGLECLPTAPATMSVIVNPGLITSPGVIDGSPFGVLAPDVNPLLKIGINTGTNIFTLVAPVTLGQAINYSLVATLQEVDNGAVVQDFYNALAPAVPFSGPGGGGASLNRYRRQYVALQVLAGAPATVGTQVTPACPPGYVPLYIITVACGQTTITSANIFQDPASPAPHFRLQQLTPGYSRSFVTGIASSFFWTVPLGVHSIKVSICGGGGGGGGANPNYAGAGNYVSAAGGGSGGYASDSYAVTPGSQIWCVVGGGGPGGHGANVGIDAAGNGSTGGTTSVGSFVAATGGLGGYWLAVTTAPGGDGGSGYGAALVCVGAFGSDGMNGLEMSLGNGAASFFGGGGRSGVGGGKPGQSPGSGGGGGRDFVCNGGAGQAGVIIIEY